MVIQLVAAARGEVHAGVGATRHLDPFAFTAGFHKYRHGSCSIVGREIERHLIARPTTLFVIEFDIRAIRQAHFGVPTVTLALDEEINTPVRVGHARQDVSVAVAIEAHAKERAPPSAIHVDFKVHDTTLLEAEVEIRRGLTGSCTAYA